MTEKTEIASDTHGVFNMKWNPEKKNCCCQVEAHNVVVKEIKSIYVDFN